MRQLDSAGKSELLISPPRSGRAVHGDGDFADRDETEPPVICAQIVKAIEQVSGSGRVVPVVAGIVDCNEVTSLLRQGASVFNQIVA